MGLCAVLLVAQAAAAATRHHAANRSRQSKEYPGDPLQTRLRHKLDEARKHRSVIRFFDDHRWLLRSREQRAPAARSLSRSRQLFADGRTGAASPRVAICGVFGRYCDEAVAVAWCESRLQTTARNGQYLGLFQMGARERRLFGHGPSAREQAVAAHRYFVVSGRDWSPWSCKPSTV